MFRPPARPVARPPVARRRPRRIVRSPRLFAVLLAIGLGRGIVALWVVLTVITTWPTAPILALGFATLIGNLPVLFLLRTFNLPVPGWLELRGWQMFVLYLAVPIVPITLAASGRWPAAGGHLFASIFMLFGLFGAYALQRRLQQWK